MTNLALNLRILSPDFTTADSAWTAQVSRYTVSRNSLEGGDDEHHGHDDDDASAPAVALESAPPGYAATTLIPTLEVGIRIGRSWARGVLGCEKRPKKIPVSNLRIRSRAGPLVARCPGDRPRSRK